MDRVDYKLFIFLSNLSISSKYEKHDAFTGHNRAG